MLGAKKLVNLVLTTKTQFRAVSSAGNWNGLIPAHGGKGLVKRLLEGEELAEEKKKAQSLRRVDVTSRENGDLIMIGIGGFSPLTGFMNRGDWQRVSSEMQLQDGTFWPIPVTLSVDTPVASSLRADEEVALYHEGQLMATMKVEDAYALSAADRDFECKHVFTTTDPEHPGVKMVQEQKAVNLGGSVKVLSEGDFPTRFAGIYQRPEESRAIFAQRGWNTIAALQLRNPMHRSHEYLAKIAIEVCDGVFIHSLVGNLKPGDIPADVRVRCIDVLVDKYFVKDKVVQGGYPLDMRYAGPREALLHALFRQNYGCTHMIIGRDHAGVGDYYGMFDAQLIFDKIPKPAEEGKRLLCQPLKIDWTFYCHKCDGPASLRTCPHDKKDRVIVSGTMLRKLLSEGGEMPDHFGRPEVLDILREYYASLTKKVEVKLHKAATG
eukprot:TRINITY_DN167_c0_g1_i2.p2 TRINITY_DN167_c0_g1~~TRINITY_DN167_c0_g1_i2.p2  ORF type:complete len:436 (-),score=66.54 TRINITY_DN167_c0_g1_i2:649-1956(-)